MDKNNKHKHRFARNILQLLFAGVFLTSSVFAAELTGYSPLIAAPFAGISSYDPNSTVDGFREVEVHGTIFRTDNTSSVFEDEYLQNVEVSVGGVVAGNPPGSLTLHQTIPVEDVQLYKELPIDPWSAYRLFIDTTGLTDEAIYAIQLRFNFESGDHVEVDYYPYFKLDTNAPSLTVNPIDTDVTSQEKSFTFACQGESNTDHCLGTVDDAGVVLGNGAADLVVKGNFCDSVGDSGKICEKDPLKSQYEVCDGTGKCTNTISLFADFFYYDPFPPKGSTAQLLRIDESSGTDTLETSDRADNVSQLDTVTVGGGVNLIDQRTERSITSGTGSEVEAHYRYVFDIVDDQDDDLEIGDSFEFNGNTHTISSFDYAGPEADVDACGDVTFDGNCRDYADGGNSKSCLTPSLVRSPFYYGEKNADATSICRQRFVRCSNSPSHRGYWDRSLSPNADVDLSKCTVNGAISACQIAATETAATDSLDSTSSAWNLLESFGSSVESSLVVGTDYIIRYKSGSWDADNTNGSDPAYYSATFRYMDEYGSLEVVGFGTNDVNSSVLGHPPSPLPEVRIRYNGGDIHYKIVDPDGNYGNNANAGLRFDIFQVVCDNELVCGNGYEYDGTTDTCVAINSCNPVIEERLEVDPWAWNNAGDAVSQNQTWVFSTDLTDENATLNNDACSWGCIDGTEANLTNDGCSAVCNQADIPTLGSNMWINNSGATTPNETVTLDFSSTSASGAAACSWGCEAGYEPDPLTGTCVVACNGVRPTTLGQEGTWANPGRLNPWESWSHNGSPTQVANRCHWGCLIYEGYIRNGNGCQRIECDAGGLPDTEGELGTWVIDVAGFDGQSYGFQGGDNPSNPIGQTCRWGCDQSDGYLRDGNSCVLPRCRDEQLPLTAGLPGTWVAENAPPWAAVTDYDYVPWATQAFSWMRCDWGCEAGYTIENGGTPSDYTDDRCVQLNCDPANLPLTNGSAGTWVNNTSQYNNQPYTLNTNLTETQPPNHCEWGCEAGYTHDDNGTPGVTSDDSCI